LTIQGTAFYTARRKEKPPSYGRTTISGFRLNLGRKQESRKP